MKETSRQITTCQSNRMGKIKLIDKTIETELNMLRATIKYNINHITISNMEFSSEFDFVQYVRAKVTALILKDIAISLEKELINP